MIARRSLWPALIWWVAAVGALLALRVWVAASERGLPSIDSRGLLLAHAWRSSWLDAAFPVLTWFGSLALLLPVVLAAAILLAGEGHRGEARFLVLSLVGAGAMARIAKSLALRPRPDLFPALVPVDSPLSFPSTHTVQVVAVAAALMFILARIAPGQWRWGASSLLFVVVLTGLSRVYLQVHYPTDVLAGAMFAACWVCGLRALMPATAPRCGSDGGHPP